MPPPSPSSVPGSPRPAPALLDLYYLQMRSALLEAAAGFDRIARAAGGAEAMRDARILALTDACALLSDGQADRTRRILERLSEEAR